MAERSFAKEVQDLRLGDGQEFSGEGILAITKALLQSGVGYVAGYQGAPISHLMDVLADAQDILSELGVRFEASANEATAAATLAPRFTASSFCFRRTVIGSSFSVQAVYVEGRDSSCCAPAGFTHGPCLLRNGAGTAPAIF